MHPSPGDKGCPGEGTWTTGDGNTELNQEASRRKASAQVEDKIRPRQRHKAHLDHLLLMDFCSRLNSIPPKFITHPRNLGV